MSLEQNKTPRVSQNDPKNVVAERLLYPNPSNYERDPTIYPFHISHKKLLERIEYKKELPEPLKGFKKAQNDLIKQLTLPEIIIPRKKPAHVRVEVETVPERLKYFLDQNEVIKLVKSNMEDKFYYMIYSLPKSSELFTPYSLRIVEYKNIDKKNFLTISKKGVLQTFGNDTVFTPLEKWQYEFNMYRILMKLKTFSNFRMWKAFYMWKKKIYWAKIDHVSKSLESNLFILNPILREAILQLQAMCHVFFHTTFTSAGCVENCHFFYFIENQMDKFEDICARLQEFRIVAKELVNNACHGALLEYGFTVDDSSFYAQFIGKRRRKIEGEPRMSYTEQANKKKFCVRLSCFITLIDYLIIRLLHMLMSNSTVAMLNIFESHMKFLPSNELLAGKEIDIVLEEKRPPHNPQLPLFNILLCVNDEKISADPSEDVIKMILKQLLTLWYDFVVGFPMFLSDQFFKPFLCPLINGKIEDRICGTGPSIKFYLSIDKELIDDNKMIFYDITRSYEAVFMYAERFRYMQEFYAEDLMKTVKEISEERALERWRYMCRRYHYEEEEIIKVLNSQPLGLLNLLLIEFKNTIQPQPRRLIEVIGTHLPILGRSKVDFLTKESEDMQIYFEIDPITTVDHVKYIEFIDIASGKVDDFETQLDYAKELYDIMEEFQIAVSPDDMAAYLNVGVSLGTLRGIVDKKVEERAKCVLKFSDQISKDMNQLIGKIGSIREECMEPWLIDYQSDREWVMDALDKLHEKILACRTVVNEYKGYQRQFKIDITRYDMVDEVLTDIKMRMLLWETLDSWYKTVEEWYAADFNTLDVEDMNTFTAKNVKNVTQLEKRLPANYIVPKLKEDIATIKDKLLVVGYLRNPALKQRHWLKIEGVLNYKFKVEEVLTLKKLESLGCFMYPNEFMELSGQASSEASLETMLRRVEEIWKALEFVVLLHKDAKDVFILGTLEDVQQALDDSNITISTIANSRHVGPIKPRVEEWVKILDNFSKTLDEWQTCQQNWVYLEIIFSAPDIQRQLPQESKLFLIVDKSWKDIMRKTAKMPIAMEAASQPKLLDTLKRNNTMLDQIMKCLEAYLETKRVAFPRFYFLSNDELLDVLAQTRNPHAVQPHLRKCFDAISKLEFGMRAEGEGEAGDTSLLTSDIMAMISPEGERVALTKGLKARGNVEDWLRKVEEAMFLSLKKEMKKSIVDYTTKKRNDWLMGFPNQVILTVAQIMWARDVHEILDKEDKTENKQKELIGFETQCYTDLNKLAGIVRTDITPIFRKVLIALITISVHSRDTLTSMVRNQVHKSTDFEWLKMLRYYWLPNIDNCVARMSSAEYLYGYEYLGAGGVLVITPLTDRCYLCLMGALQLDLGGAPAGPAGTGKTETTKDLAKSVAVQCVVFNCSEGLDYKMMGRFFSGLAQSGAWCCFDEFNRIDIEVLSVIAQQLITIRNAKAAKAKRFMFEGREIKLVQTCAAFITMNPGYAGRTELPDNLKALFRPISMMVPDYALIAEVTLYSEGFESSKMLAQKMVQMYKLCSEQLSQQDHYDFGMRAVKSVLVMAGALKRSNPDIIEDVVLIRALRDSNLPKFLADDAQLFQGILGDLFPGVTLPEQDYGVLQDAIEFVIKEMGLQVEPCQIVKVIQLFETMIVRWGVMLVGPTGGGKTSVLNILKNSLTKLRADEVPGQYYHTVHTYVLNPKSVTLGELYGEVNSYTMEWRDGLLGLMVRTAVQSTNEDHQWVICDGPVDAVWIENMNTVLDDNKMLCLANSERIKLTPYVHMVFEVQDLAQASPATVSRCGMVYIDPDELKWLPFVKTWLTKITEKLNNFTTEVSIFVLSLFEKYVESGFVFLKKNGDYGIHQVDIAKINMMCNLFESIITQPGGIEKVMEKSILNGFIVQTFIFSYIWSVGGNLLDSVRDKFEMFVRDQFEENPHAHLPNDELWGVFMDMNDRRLGPWARILPQFEYNPEQPFFETIVPTTDTVRFGYLMERLIVVNKPVLFIGETGVGKSVIAKVVLNNLSKSGKFVPVTLNFSAQTSSSRTQEILELRLEKLRKNLLGAPVGKKVVIFVDDVNMPKLDTYGAQPPIELLRQYLDFNGLYDREKLFWKRIVDVIITAACAPPGGGRNPLTPRFVRHFGMLLIPPLNEFLLKSIFKAIIKGFLKDFANPIRDLSDSIVNAAVDIYDRIAKDLLPTPTKSHYIFNLRDLGKCVQGILQTDSTSMREPAQMMRLFYHECLRVFHDRLINIEDKSYFYYLMREVCNRYFGTPVLILPDEAIIQNPPVLLFGDFIVFGSTKENRYYEEIRDINKVKLTLQDYLDDFNLTYSKNMKIIFFMDALEHIARIARILRAERGNCLLVGVGGMGKQSATKLAAHVNEYKCLEIELTRNYDHSSFFEDLRKFYFAAGAANENTVFLFTDTQIIEEEFLEDINNILNSGDVPNLFESDELEKVINACRPAAKEIGVAEGNRDAIYEFFINRVRSNLHLSLCMSPIGDAFRRRCRMFPSLVNCCSIDWFMKWPEEALLSVAQDSLQVLGDKTLVDNLAVLCFVVHESVEKTTVRYYEEMKRYYYTTPSSYLDLLKLYHTMLKTKREEISKSKSRIANGLTKLYETNTMIDTMKITLTDLKPQLAMKSIAVEEMMKNLVKEQASADTVRKVVKEDEVNALEKAAESSALAEDAQKDLDQALPAMEAATKALQSLNKQDINELRVFQKPPQLVRFVMEAVCLLLGSKLDWNSAKNLLGDTNFLKRLQEYDKDNIPESLMKKLKVYIDDKDFVPDTVATVSKVCKSMCMWVRAIDTYVKVFKIVEPKRKRQQAAETELNQVMAVLREKQKKLAEVEAHIANLQQTFENTCQEKQDLEDNLALTAARLVRAGRLTMALGDEQTRWEQDVKSFNEGEKSAIGDVLIAAACVAYLGAFTSNYREELVKMWVGKCDDFKILISKPFNLIKILANPFEIRFWNTCGLPRDSVSTENAILVTQAGRWPLMIDPQEQANRWIRNMESNNSLMIIKFTDSNYMRNMESAIRIGLPVLLEEVGETLDPALGPILLKQTYLQGGRLLIHLGDSDIDYDNNFRLYITTKLSNPHYLPEICIRVTLVNFTVTPSGLEDQLLADVVRLERPDLEAQRNELIVRINNDKSQLSNIEEKILRLLYVSKGNILDDEDLIETLNESKETSAIIETRLTETEATEKNISIAREKYRSVATRGSVLYFVVARLADIDPMYQYSLKYFKQIFNMVIETSEKNSDLNVRLEILYREITLAMYVNVSRGLFERHKLVFSFMLCIDILKQKGEIKETQWNYLLRGPVGTQQELPPKPDVPALTEAMWISTNYLANTFTTFKSLPDDALLIIPISVGAYKIAIKIAANATKEKTNWNSSLSEFEKLMILKCLKEEKLVFAITEFVKLKLGMAFVESPQVSLQLLYADTSNVTPLVFVLSTGSDPFGAFQRFAAETGNLDKIQSISLGQGQGPVAEKMIGIGKLRGDWVFLQNCHLATSWMIAMERIIQRISEDVTVHNDFRIFLSSMPSRSFPVSVLQNAVKVTNEPPKGIRANIKRAFGDMNDEFFEIHHLEHQWRSMIFGISMFHAIIQERKKFGPLGWNITYEFNDSDRECAFNTMKMFCAEEDKIPWDALEYITGEITYGGRVTDYWDLRCLKTILKGFFSPTTVVPNYKYSQSGTYYCPQYKLLNEYQDFIETFPIIEDPEIFGMHENANIAFQTKETQTIILTVLESQPRSAAGKTGISSDDIVYELSEMVVGVIKPIIRNDEPYPALFKNDEKGRLPSLTTVLTQEVDRFNKLLKLIHSSMNNLQKAIKGLVVMSDILEEVFTAFLNNQVPKLWSAKAYPSLKTLGGWVHDLQLRIDFINMWLAYGPPVSFWISGFFFPQGFLTGSLQTHARKYDLPIDTLGFNFIVTPKLLSQEEVKKFHDENMCEDPTIYGNLTVPEDGVNIHGLFLDAAKWNFKKMGLDDQLPGEMNPAFPAMILIPIVKSFVEDPRYICPLYKTSARAGVLSTTGHSTNFVVSVLLGSDKPQYYWILKGTALLTQIND